MGRNRTGLNWVDHPLWVASVKWLTGPLVQVPPAVQLVHNQFLALLLQN